MSYEDLKNKHPELNWSEAENEIDDSDLGAASDMFDKLVSERKSKSDDTGNHTVYKGTDRT